MLRLRGFLLLRLIFIFPYVEAEESLNLIFPPPGKDGAQPTFTADNKIHIQWTTTYNIINVQVWQGPDEMGTRAFLNLLTNQTTDIQDYHWAAQTIAGFTIDYPMYIRLVNAEEKDCTSCQARSVNFSILESANTNTTSPPSTSTTSATSEPNDSSSSTIKLGLGIGLGLGLPFVAALSVLSTWLYFRRRRRRDATIQTVSAYEAAETPKQPLQAKAAFYAPSSGYTSSTDPKTPQAEIDGPPILELQPTAERVEAPRDAQRAELEGNGLLRQIGGKWT